MTRVKFKRGIFSLVHNALDTRGVNVAVVLRAMGVQSDQVRLSHVRRSNNQSYL